MVVRRAATGYRRLDDGEDVDEDSDAIPLKQAWRRPSKELESKDIGTVALDKHHWMVHSAPSPQDSEFSYKAKPQAIRSHRPVQQRFLTGWRVGALASLVGATSAFVFNLAITSWVRQNHTFENAIGTLYVGSCAKARKSNVWLHLAVNVLSTLLLAASNYCMQVLSAPNREELVRAHGRRFWLHIGVPSLRNLRHIGLDRAILWSLLFASSVPLHLLYNSVVFLNLQANIYGVIPTTEDWLDGGPYNTSGFLDMKSGFTVTDQSVNTSTLWYDYLSDFDAASAFEEYRIDRVNASQLQDPKTGTKYLNLSTSECFNRYNEQYISGVGNVYLIQESPTVWRNLSIWYPEFNRTGQFRWTRNETTNPKPRKSYRHFPFLSMPKKYPSNGWRCPSREEEDCDVGNENEVPQDRSQWKPYGSRIKYCIVEKVGEFCRLQFNFNIALAVVLSNFVKVICMALTLLRYKKHSAIVTTGDAVGSFLDYPDPETRGRCLHSRRLFEAEWNWEQTHGARKDGLGIEPEQFIPKSYSWATVPSRARWFATYLLYFAAIIFGIVCMARSLAGMPKDPIKLWQVGFGKVTGNNLLNTNTSLMGGVLLANAPQAVLSYLYLAFNALYTNMFVAHEWSNYFNERKPLRVTSPIGQQRGTYWLTVPFRYAVPMTIVSGLFHWLTSQSIFMVLITVTDTHWGTRDVRPNGQISTCGYSPMAIILTTVTGTVIALGGIAMGKFWRYPAGMPLAGSCSAAISAACHPPVDDVDASVLPVQWGAVSQGEPASGRDGGKRIGHCTFSSLPVETPIVGRLYA